MTQTFPRSALGNRYVLAPRRTLSGLSAGPTVQQIAGAALASGTGIATAIAAGASLTIPIIGAAFAGVMLGVQAILNSGCGQTCIVTSNWANQAESKLTQNLNEYFSIPAPRPQSAKTAALQNFDAIWNYLVQECSSPQLGTAGQNCIGDRQSGACKWKQTSNSPLLSYPGEPQPGACWNWFNGYRDPIAKDSVISDAQYSAQFQPQQQVAISNTDPSGVPNVADSSTSLVTSSVGGIPILLIAGAALVLFGMSGGSN